MFVMFCVDQSIAKLFPTIGFLTINELSSLEDLPDLETDNRSNEQRDDDRGPAE